MICLNLILNLIRRFTILRHFCLYNKNTDLLVVFEYLKLVWLLPFFSNDVLEEDAFSFSNDFLALVYLEEKSTVFPFFENQVFNVLNLKLLVPSYSFGTNFCFLFRCLKLQKAAMALVLHLLLKLIITDRYLALGSKEPFFSINTISLRRYQWFWNHHFRWLNWAQILELRTFAVLRKWDRSLSIIDFI